MASINPIGTSTVQQTSTDASQAPTKTDFLKLLVAQLSHQDPLAPKDDTAFVSQLAQFAALEQAQGQTALLKQVQGQLGAQANTMAVGLVGRKITASFSSILIDSGKPQPLQFTLAAPATSVTLILRDGKGNAVRTIKTSPLGAGAQSIGWDGRGDDGQPLSPGPYALGITATGVNGVVGARPEIQGAVSGISYESGTPALLVGGAQVQLRDVIQVSQ